MSEKKNFLRSARTISICTLMSRLLGLARDIICASFFGTGIAWDAFVVAFKIPNLFRRLFGEGALSAAFIPVFTEYIETKERKCAMELVNVTGTALLVTLSIITLFSEVSFAIVLRIAPLNHKWDIVLNLLMITFPYVLFICMVAFATAVLNSLKHFFMPAMAPIILNISWIIGVFTLTPLFGETLEKKIFGVAVAILAGGLIQLGIQFPVLRKMGVLFRPSLCFSHPGFRRIIKLMLPIIFGLAAVQINVLLDSIIAITFSKPPGSTESFSIGSISIPYPLETGAVSVLYYGDRLIQFPLGVFGIAMATAVFPFFSTHAARKDWKNFALTYNQAIRVILFIGIPASVGLLLLRRPLVELFYERNAFTAESTYRTAAVIAYYALGVWAYSALHVIVRAFYSVQDTMTPVKVGAGMVLLNLFLNITLIWFLKEGGLALATAISATVQTIILFTVFQRKLNITGTKHIFISLMKTAVSTLLMTIVCWIVLSKLPAGDDHIRSKLLRIFVPLALAIVTYFATSLLLRSDELKYLYTNAVKKKP
ncbi:MAG: murein biosynthesis integral membrane protein MurJ [Planctomycetes bacterium]|nr:murein biosynthesis integral membrane protein MurJ [Planctomycetota bacterium]